MAPTEQPIPLPQPMHTENSQRVFHSHSLPLQFYFCSSLIYINDFFFWSYFSFSFCLSPRINMRIGIFFLLLAFVCDNCPRSSCSTNMCLVPILCVCRAHNNFFSSSSSSSSCSVICVLCVVRCRSLDLTMHICTTHARVIRIQV